ncbi:translation initiation factor IF-2-like, partial [Meles meles]|uniref:translation initiation factor IF-2-like n=1 Tax=Meles meles TaxID=9662 RepID=UPI001E6984E7
SGGPGKGAGRGILGAGPIPQECAKVLGPAKGPWPQPTPAGWPEEQLPGGCAAPGSGAGGRPRRGPEPPRCREGSRPAAGGVGEGRPGLRPVGGVQPGPRVRLSAGSPALGSQAPRRDSPERPGSASWCPSGCPCLCSDSTWCSSPPRRRLRVALRGAGVTFKAGGQARGYAGGGGGAAPGLGWGAGRPLGGRGGGGSGSGSGGSGSAGGLRWRGGSAGSPSRPARLPLSRSSAMAAAAATDKHLTAQAERPPPPSPPPPQRDEIRPRGWRGEEEGRRAGEWRDWGEGEKQEAEWASAFSISQSKIARAEENSLFLTMSF